MDFDNKKENLINNILGTINTNVSVRSHELVKIRLRVQYPFRIIKRFSDEKI